VAKVLFFNSKNEAVLTDCKVEDGRIIYQDKSFVVDKSYPLLLKSAVGYQPLYIIKWDSLEPSYNLNPPGKILFRLKNKEITMAENYTVVEPQWRDWIKEGISPEMVRRLMGLQILGNMIKVKKKIEVQPMVTLVLGILIGVLALYWLLYFKIIRI